MFSDPIWIVVWLMSCHKWDGIQNYRLLHTRGTASSEDLVAKGVTSMLIIRPEIAYITFKMFAANVIDYNRFPFISWPNSTLINRHVFWTALFQNFWSVAFIEFGYHPVQQIQRNVVSRHSKLHRGRNLQRVQVVYSARTLLNFM